MSSQIVPVGPPGHEGDQGLRPLCLGLTWALTSVALIIVAIRFHLRINFGQALASDDWTMLFALVLQLIYQGLYTEMCNWGNGLPQNDIKPYQQLQISKYSYMSAIPSILVSVIARISISILLIRIFGSKRSFKIYIIICTTLLSFAGLLSLAFLGASSRPWRGLWTPSLPAKKLNLQYYSYTALGLQFLMVITDLTYVLFPVLIIWRLNMRSRTKLAIVFLMSVSLITMAIATTKVALIFIRLKGSAQEINQTQRYFQSLVNLVADCEQCLVIILGCVPALKLLSNFKLQFPLVTAVTQWLISLLPGSRSRSRDRELSTIYNTSERPRYQDMGSQTQQHVAQEGEPKVPARKEVWQQG